MLAIITLGLGGVQLTSLSHILALFFAHRSSYGKTTLEVSKVDDPSKKDNELKEKTMSVKLTND